MTVGKHIAWNLLLISFIVNIQVLHASDLLLGQCPLRVPTSLSTTSPAELFLHEHDSSSSSSTAENKFNKRPPLLTIAHGGSSFNIPPHTLPSYRLALELNTDYIQTNLVSTSDGVLVAVSSIDLNRTTNVADVFPDRYREDVVRDGIKLTGYFVHDFTLEEIQSLRVRRESDKVQNMESSDHIDGDGCGIQSDYFDGIFSIPTVTDIFDLVHDWNTHIRRQIQRPTINTVTREGNSTTTSTHYHGKRIGISIELKLPNWIKEDSNDTLSTPDLLLNILKTHPHAAEMFFGVVPTDGTGEDGMSGTGMTNFGCERHDHYQVPPLVIECFSSETLRYLHTHISEETDIFHGALPPMLYLVSSRECKEENFWFHNIESGGFRSIITGISVDKTCLVGAPPESEGEGIFHNEDKALAFGKDFMTRVNEHNLVIHAWTQKYEVESVSLSERFRNSEDELRYLYCVLNIHGVKTETVDIALRVAIRGCDDFKTPEEFIEDEIKIEEEIGETVDNSTIAKRICASAEKAASNNGGAIAGVFTAILGMIVGGFVSFYMTVQYYVKRSRIQDGSEEHARGIAVRSVPTTGDDTSRHLPEIGEIEML